MTASTSTAPVAAAELPSPQEFADTFAALEREIGKVVVGHREALRRILVAFFAGGHVLIEGVPGIGKTLIVRSLGEALNLSFSRVQFTIDLMPADITGTRMLEEGDSGRRTMVFVPGPLFAHIVLADEINRATPKTQSALLEAMAELQVTVAGKTHALHTPFFVLATLNPIEMEGTYPLPEAQLDRFLFKVPLSYPEVEELRQIVRGTTGAQMARISPVFEFEPARRINALRHLVREVIVAPQVEDYVAALVRETIPEVTTDARVKQYVSFGSSPRGAQALILGAKAIALLRGRVNVAFSDVEEIAVPALAHRLVVNFAAETEGVTARSIVDHLVEAGKKWQR
ncbi:MAG TPA: MoxR family ATPase [Candidatus Binatia bacterium]|nr:MoxR family ATPase [Candidatus Binatia bacterium]